MRRQSRSVRSDDVASLKVQLAGTFPGDAYASSQLCNQELQSIPKWKVGEQA